jgi:hypothetical protein
VPIDSGRTFREAWIAGVNKYYPGEPKPSYVVPWEETPEWERSSAAAVFDLVRALIDATDGKAAKLTRQQKGQFIAVCWVAQIYKHFPDPKRSYVADWDDLPQWQRDTNGDIFESMERD